MTRCAMCGTETASRLEWLPDTAWVPVCKVCCEATPSGRFRMVPAAPQRDRDGKGDAP